VRTTRYGQKALAFAVTHPIPHENVSTEIHRSGGPFTLVPLPDYTGEDGVARPSSAVVWMERGPEVRRLLDLDTPAFEAEMTERSAHLFGPLTLASRPHRLAHHQPDRRGTQRRTRRAGGRGRACPAAHRGAGAEHEPCGYPHASGPGGGIAR
jgi:2-polyprenyl-6-methoxyphenol hydroxylase-like FAD-dependent oxidoreductase